MPARPGVLLLVAVWLVTLASSVAAYVPHPGTAGPLGGDLAAEHRAVIERALAAAVRAPVSPERPAASLAVDALLAAEMLRRGDRRFEAMLDRRLELLLAAARPSADGSLGWGEAPDSGGTPIALGFPTAMAILALARGADVLDRGDYAEIASRSLQHWASLAFQPGDCPACRIVPATDAPAGRQELVRNINVLMGLAGAAAAAAGRSDAGLAGAMIAAEADERDKGNAGYLSVRDRRWPARPDESRRIENHSAAIATALLATAGLLGSPRARELALSTYALWAGCSNRPCRVGACTYWAADPSRCLSTATFTHCAFRGLQASAAQACGEALARARSLNTGQLLLIATGDRPAAP